jgi:arylsulfatase
MAQLTRRQVMKQFGAVAGSSGLTSAAQVSPASGKTPNVIFILCDDLGFGDLECYGSEIKTPNLNRLAAEGNRFTNFCSADPVCSPSRAALLTGRYPARVGVPRVLFPKDQGGLNLDEQTLADVLRRRGYRTACVGKWHLGRPNPYMPTSRGFDEYLGIPYSNDMKPRPLIRNTDVIEETANLDSLTERYTEFATGFIRDSKARPFFLYMPHTFPHIPLGVSTRFRGKSALGLYGDVIEEIDWSVGEVLKSVRDNGLDKDTLVMFSSDNGPWYQGSPGRLRGRKNSTYEGGVREPFIARWPGVIPGGLVTDEVASMLDVFPTVMKVCGATLPSKPLDGIDIWPLLTGKTKSIERKPLLYFNDWNLQCARWVNWKLHVARFNTAPYVPLPPGGLRNFVLPKPELYNLASDPDESYDVAPSHPEVVQKMLQSIESLISGFPEEVRNAYAEAKRMRADPEMPIGAWPNSVL